MAHAGHSQEVSAGSFQVDPAKRPERRTKLLWYDDLSTMVTAKRVQFYPANGEPADGEPADSEPADCEPADDFVMEVDATTSLQGFPD